MKLSYSIWAAKAFLVRFSLSQPTDTLEKRLDGGVYVCPGPNWTGPCQHINMNDVHGDFPGCWTIPWQTLGSIGPDAGWICSMYVEPGNCDGSNPHNGNSGGIVAPGVSDLRFWSQGGNAQDYWFHNARTVQCIPW